jgi:Na+-transporting methylmalonyl-CoA/oxaloacetate decarboxylase gamma subunit
VDFLTKVLQSEGLTVSMAGVVSVFTVLFMIWSMIRIYTWLFESKEEETDVQPTFITSKAAPTSPEPTGAPVVEEDEIEQNVRPDPIPVMAAAAAVAAFIKRRRRSISARAPQFAGAWSANTRAQALHNNPNRNPWRR